MHHNLRFHIAIPFCALVAAFAVAGCSHDTRAILAPSDAQISFAPNGPVIANQPVEITVSALKNDGNPVKDGTEIQLTASAGGFESTKIRTQGGQAVALFHAADPGPVEIEATSDDARGQTIIFAASTAPSHVSIEAPEAFVPEGGGEVEVTATVTGASGEPVVGAGVEFFATNGSFAPVGPFLTNAQGKATARLNTPSATQVRARVFSLESSTLDIEVLAPGDQPGLPFRMRDLVLLHAPEAKDWDVTSEITDVTFQTSGSHVTDICFPHTKAGKWKRSGAGEGNVWVVAEVDGTWYAATWDYIRPGQVCKSASGFTWDDRRDGIFAHTQKIPLEGRVPHSGDAIGFMVSGFARTTQRTVLERSNIFMTTWP